MDWQRDDIRQGGEWSAQRKSTLRFLTIGYAKVASRFCMSQHDQNSSQLVEKTETGFRAATRCCTFTSSHPA
jgi:hypothetical protein